MRVHDRRTISRLKSVSEFNINLPPGDVVKSKDITRSVLKILIPVAVVVVVGIGALAGSAGWIGGAIAVAIMALILGIELPLIRRGQHRQQQRLMESLPSRGIYQSRASMFSITGARSVPTTGLLLLDELEVRFTPKNTKKAPTSIVWTDVARFRLAPMPGKIGVGLLTLNLKDNSARKFSIANFGPMAKQLEAVTSSR
jgi:hypothetical protein